MRYMQIKIDYNAILLTLTGYLRYKRAVNNSYKTILHYIHSCSKYTYCKRPIGFTVLWSEDIRIYHIESIVKYIKELCVFFFYAYLKIFSFYLFNLLFLGWNKASTILSVSCCIFYFCFDGVQISRYFGTTTTTPTTVIFIFIASCSYIWIKSLFLYSFCCNNILCTNR